MEASLVQGVIQDREPSCSFLDFPGLLNILWKAPVLEEGQDWGHLAACTLDCKGKDFFNAGTFLDFHLEVHTRWFLF